MSSKELALAAFLTAVVIVTMATGFSHYSVSMRNIPIYIMQDPCYGKTVLLEINFSDYTDVSQIDNSKWVVSIGKGGIAEIKNGVLRLSEANLYNNITNYKTPVNATVVVLAKINKSEYYPDYKGYSQADIMFYQNLNNYKKGNVYPGMFVFSQNGGAGSGASISDFVNVPDKGYAGYDEDYKNSITKSSFYHYQRKYIGVNRNEFNYYMINRSFASGNYLKSFYISNDYNSLTDSANLKAVLNLTKPFADGNGNGINEKFVVHSYPYQAIYVKMVKICA